MAEHSVDKTASTGIAVTTAGSHSLEIAGRAVEAASKTVGCPVGQAVGRALQSAGRAAADKSVEVGRRDQARLKG